MRYKIRAEFPIFWGSSLESRHNLNRSIILPYALGGPTTTPKFIGTCEKFGPSNYKEKAMHLMIAVFILVGAVGAISKNADAMTGNTFLSICEGIHNKNHPRHNSHDNSFCSGFIAGVVEGYHASDEGQKVICFPKGVTYDQKEMVVLRNIKANPGRLHHYAPYLIISAVREAFPCN